MYALIIITMIMISIFRSHFGSGNLWTYSTPGSSPLVAPMDPPSGAPSVGGTGAVDDFGVAASVGGGSGPQLPPSQRTGNAVPYPVSLDCDVTGHDSSDGVGGVVGVHGVSHASGLDGADFTDSISSIATSGVFTDSTSVSIPIGVRRASGIGCELGRLPPYSRQSFPHIQERFASAFRSGRMMQMTLQTEGTDHLQFDDEVPVAAIRADWNWRHLRQDHALCEAGLLHFDPGNPDGGKAWGPEARGALVVALRGDVEFEVMARHGSLSGAVALVIVDKGVGEQQEWVLLAESWVLSPKRAESRSPAADKEEEEEEEDEDWEMEAADPHQPPPIPAVLLPGRLRARLCSGRGETARLLRLLQSTGRPTRREEEEAELLAFLRMRGMSPAFFLREGPPSSLGVRCGEGQGAE